MVIRLTPELEKIVEERLKSGQFQTPEEVVAEALRALPARLTEAEEAERKTQQREAVARMLEFVKKNRVKLEGITVKELIHEGHRW